MLAGAVLLLNNNNTGSQRLKEVGANRVLRPFPLE